ncbi:MAG: hypothetical protein KBT47_03900, partial [Armatimonadetes bacterium]|nr:hypothetical protein [Candidatus Hippobium faecium]
MNFTDMKRNRIKIQYCILVVAYIFIFAFMPSLHCHIKYLDYTPHCFHCHGHITPIEEEEEDCPFCPIINLNTVSVSSAFIFIFSWHILSEKLLCNNIIYRFSYI